MNPLYFGPSGLLCAKSIYSGYRLAQHQLLGHILTRSCKYCLAVQRRAKKRGATLERLAEVAMAATV